MTGEGGEGGTQQDYPSAWLRDDGTIKSVGDIHREEAKAEGEPCHWSFKFPMTVGQLKEFLRIAEAEGMCADETPVSFSSWLGGSCNCRKCAQSWNVGTEDWAAEVYLNRIIFTADC